MIIRFLPADLLALPICGAVRAVCCERGESATKRISASRVMEVVSSTYLWFCLLAGFLATVSTSRWDRSAVERARLKSASETRLVWATGFAKALRRPSFEGITVTWNRDRMPAEDTVKEGG